VEQSLITVECDKASMEIPSSARRAWSKSSRSRLGDKVNIGDLVAILEGAAGAAAAAAAPAAVLPRRPPRRSSRHLLAAAAAAAPRCGRARRMRPARTTVGLPHASPSVRKFARELGVPLAEVKGSGPKGRITEADVQGFTRSVMSRHSANAGHCSASQSAGRQQRRRRLWA